MLRGLLNCFNERIVRKATFFFLSNSKIRLITLRLAGMWFKKKKKKKLGTQASVEPEIC